jgi:hypothetical protein
VATTSGLLDIFNLEYRIEDAKSSRGRDESLSWWKLIQYGTALRAGHYNHYEKSLP